MSNNPRPGDAAAADDLTRIGGIGSKTAERLNAAGIRTYAELASRSVNDIIMLLPDVSGLSPARLDSWRDQARELAAASPAQTVPDTPGNGQRYESFLVRVLLNEDGSIRRTTAQHIGTGAESRWSSLDRRALPDFIESAISSSSEPVVPRQAETASELVRPLQAEAPELPTPLPAESRPAAAPTVPAERVRLISSAVLSVERTVLRATEPFTLTMTVDLAESTTGADRLAYSTIVVARPVSAGPKLTVAQSDGVLASTSSAISIDAAGLPPGAYRLDGAVSLREPGGDHAVGLAALAEGLLVHVLPS